MKKKTWTVGWAEEEPDKLEMKVKIWTGSGEDGKTLTGWKENRQSDTQTMEQ